MCQHGNLIHMKIEIPARLSHTGKSYSKPVGIDACIFPIVKTLNDNDIPTDASCCGHGKIAGSIILRDGRELIIAKDWDEARRIFDVAYNIDIHGHKLRRQKKMIDNDLEAVPEIEQTMDESYKNIMSCTSLYTKSGFINLCQIHGFKKYSMHEINRHGFIGLKIAVYFFFLNFCAWRRLKKMKEELYERCAVGIRVELKRTWY